MQTKDNENQEMANPDVNTIGGRVAVAAEVPAVLRYQGFVSVASRRFRRAKRCILDSFPSRRGPSCSGGPTDRDDPSLPEPYPLTRPLRWRTYGVMGFRSFRLEPLAVLRMSAAHTRPSVCRSLALRSR
jgi:hypothetical protein